MAKATLTKGPRGAADRIEGIQREDAPQAETNRSALAFCDSVFGRCRKGQWPFCEEVLARFSYTDTSIEFIACRVFVRLSWRVPEETMHYGLSVRL